VSSVAGPTPAEQRSVALDHVRVNRAPVLTLWAAVVARRLGFNRDEALTLGRVVAGLNAYAKGKALNLYPPHPKTLEQRRKAAQSGEVIPIELLGRMIPVASTPSGFRALSKGMPVDPGAVKHYLEARLSTALPAVEAALTSLAQSMDLADLRARAFELYEVFRPVVPSGARGWGALGTLDIEQIRQLSRNAAPGSRAQ